jgi:hypothetical protein
MADIVDAETFRAWMAPKVAAIRALTSAVDAVADRHGDQPASGSRARTERDAEGRYSAQSTWEHPIMDTHAFGAMTLRAATDNLRGFAALFASGPPPLYPHLVLGRSAFEGTVVCEWLSDPQVDPLERIKRGLCEQLYSAKEVEDLNLQPGSPSRVDEWTAVAQSFGWTVNLSRSRPIIDVTKRPRLSDGIVRLVGSDAGSRIGDLLFSRLSAVDHVTWFGLQWAIDLEGASTEQLSRVATVVIGTDGAQVSAIGFYLVRALRAAATARFDLMAGMTHSGMPTLNKPCPLRGSSPRHTCGARASSPRTLPA